MGLKYANKINKIRTFALGLVFVGILVMYIGIFFRESQVIMIIAMLLGLLFVISSTVVYFWIGMLSTRTIQVVCPNCGGATKMLGRVDACMHCREPLTLDKSLEGKEFDEAYNKKKQEKGDLS
ncbi:YgzB family protein [Halalkalibacter sp. APA_J-10(15)]|uniref:YgzB family protein n=1 Tax=Halalkalibacter sp. APA_J-10(15) TaxID=2933805 RepID=UPI001FF4BE4C|nr:YgzB family protein [Halalkalibacter sp. APA_J-10(15)]MCK0472513.1 YgzB family protein [Halalkalibacter sp. APA_J-10(15)]